MKKYLNNISILLISILFVTACTKMDEYKDFAPGGEISYTGKIDSVIIFPGDGRIYFRGLIMSDPKVTECRIFWNGGTDSLSIAVQRTENVDTVKQYISLPENLYNFIIYTYDAVGNKSIPVYTIGRSYGDAYKASISNRLIMSALVNEASEAKIEWRNIDKTLGAFATDLLYTNNQGVEKTYRVDIDETETILPDYKPGSNFSYHTLYRPDTLCIDTFTTITEVYKTAYKIDKRNWIATADTYEPTGQLPNGGDPSFVIDDNPDTYWHTVHSTHTTPFPHWLAFDMGEKVIVEMVELTSRSTHYFADFRNFRVEGRNTETEEWTVYGSFLLEETPEPQQFSISGSPEMRYLRIYQLDGTEEPHSHLAEFSVYGNYTEE